MAPMNRREFFKFVLAATGGILGYNLLRVRPSAARAFPHINAGSGLLPLARREYGGNNLSGWEVVLGDGVYTAPGEPPVNSADIETNHYPDYSELRANTMGRRVMAHNITFKRIVDDDARRYVHTARYKFRLPYQPSTSNVNLNGETVEGHLSIWDGMDTDLEYLVAFQWIINPWAADYGAVQVWNNPGVWTPVGQLTPDTEWHEIEMVLDTANANTIFKMDGVQYSSYFVALAHSDWGNEIAARLAAEVISLYPGEAGDGAFHHSYFKDWYWVWETHDIYLPVILRGS